MIVPTPSFFIGKRIALARKNAGLTQATLAEMIGISEKYLSRAECGKQSLNATIIIKICESLRVSADELLLTKSIASNDILDSIVNFEMEKFSPNDKERIISILQAINAIKNNH